MTKEQLIELVRTGRTAVDNQEPTRVAAHSRICLGCQAQEQPDFKSIYRCPNYVDGREPEGQMEMEESE